MNSLSTFKHIFIDNQAKKTLFLLHGTGGSEHDLLPLVKELSDHYNFVGIKGNISEHGMARFFERDQSGVFNQDSIGTETHKLSEFIKAWKKEHPDSTSKTAFLGYSNGATMILATAFRYPELIRLGVILHPMLPFNPEDINLEGSSFFISYGTNDQLISASKSEEVVEVLKKLGAATEVVSHDGGHTIQSSEVTNLQSFLRQY